MNITISSHMDNYKSATIRTFARCLHIDTIAMFCIARHLEPQDAYMLARAWRDAAQKHNAVHTLAWMYCEVVSCLHDGNNYHV